MQSKPSLQAQHVADSLSHDGFSDRRCMLGSSSQARRHVETKKGHLPSEQHWEASFQTNMGCTLSSTTSLPLNHAHSITLILNTKRCWFDGVGLHTPNHVCPKRSGQAKACLYAWVLLQVTTESSMCYIFVTHSYGACKAAAIKLDGLL